ncbi:MAG: hypothetical protein WCO23_04875 [bacterium]
MKYKVCGKCQEIVTKTGFVSSSKDPKKENKSFSKCHNRECGQYFSEKEYTKLNEIEL